MAQKGDNSQWVEMPLVLDWKLYTTTFTSGIFVYSGTSENTDGIMTTTGSSAYQQRLVNLLPMKDQNGTWSLVKRDQAAQATTFAKDETVANPRGIFWSNALGRLIEMWGAKLFLHTNDDAYTEEVGFGTGGGAASPCGHTDGMNSSGVAYAFVSSVNQSVTISPSDVVTVISDADFPATVVPMPVFMDGYVFIASAVAGNTRRIYNCVVGNETSWTASGFTEAEETSGELVGLVKHHKSIVALCRDRIEFFKNGAIPAPNSPLIREPEHMIKIGCSNRATIATNGDITYFIGRDSNGRSGVYKIENFKVSKVSNSSIDAILDIYGGVGLNFGSGQSYTISGTTGNLFATGYFMPHKGRLYYCLVTNAGQAGTSGSTHLSIPPSWLYDVEAGIWIEIACYHNDTTKTRPNVYGGWAYPYGTWIRSTATLSSGYRFVMQLVYGGVTGDTNITYLDAETANGEAPAVGGGYSTNTQGDIVCIIQTPALDFGIANRKALTGLQISLTAPYVSTNNPFVDGRFLDSAFYQYSRLPNAVDSTTTRLATYDLDSMAYTPSRSEHVYIYRNSGAYFYSTPFYLQIAARNDSLNIDHVRLRISTYEEQ